MRLADFYNEMIVKYYRSFARKYTPDIDIKKIDLAFAENALRTDTDTAHIFRKDFVKAKSFLDQRSDSWKI